MKRRAIYNTFAVLLISSGACLVVTAQSLSQKLDQQTDYRVRALRPDEQLIEVSRHFQIPMGIEWLDQPASADQSNRIKFERGSVLELIKAILAQAPQEQMVFDDRLVRIFAPSAFKSRLNFLNLKLRGYCVSHESVLGADFQLRVGLDEMLYPKYFKYGSNGGYGGGDWLLLIDELTICMNKPSIRDVLNEIVGQSGRSAWIVNLKPEELQGERPFWKGVPINEYGTSPLTGRWRFVELREYQ
ncbi:MAG TPA: hypothetical protein VF397_15640 [Pyrinomonadaceae bacterium]